MTQTIVRTSRDLVRQTRLDWGLDNRAFGLRLGYTGEYTGQIERGLRTFSQDAVARGTTHPDLHIRQFWLDYLALRFREQQQAIVDNCIGVAQADLPE